MITSFKIGVDPLNLTDAPKKPTRSGANIQRGIKKTVYDSYLNEPFIVYVGRQNTNYVFNVDLMDEATYNAWLTYFDSTYAYYVELVDDTTHDIVRGYFYIEMMVEPSYATVLGGVQYSNMSFTMIEKTR